VNQPGPLAVWKLVAIGVAAGVIGGGLGVGGGIVLVPLLVVAGMKRHRAHATSLAAIVLIAAAGAISFGASGEFDLTAGVTIGIGGIVGSTIGASVMNRVSARALTIVFAVVLMVAGVRLIVTADPLPGADDFSSVAQVVISLMIGLVAGFVSGLSGVGGGVVIVPSSVLLLALDQHAAQGTSLLAIVFTALAGTIVNFRNKRVRLRDGLAAGMGGVVGALIGSQVALRIDGRALAVIFGLLVLFVAVRSAWQALRSQLRVP
jgi:uncharacterized protein